MTKIANIFALTASDKVEDPCKCNRANLCVASEEVLTQATPTMQQKLPHKKKSWPFLNS